MAQAYPHSTIVGSDYHAESIELARKKAAEAGVARPGQLRGGDRADLHRRGLRPGDDVRRPARHGRPGRRRASGARGAGTDDGTWLLVEPNASDVVEENFNPVGRLYYAGSTFLCVPNGLSQPGGYALGAQAGEAAIRDVVTQAGFTRFRRAAQSPFNLVYEIRP